MYCNLYAKYQMNPLTFAACRAMTKMSTDAVAADTAQPQLSQSTPCVHSYGDTTRSFFLLKLRWFSMVKKYEKNENYKKWLSTRTPVCGVYCIFCLISVFMINADYYLHVGFQNIKLNLL